METPVSNEEKSQACQNNQQLALQDLANITKARQLDECVEVDDCDNQLQELAREARAMLRKCNEAAANLTQRGCPTPQVPIPQ